MSGPPPTAPAASRPPPPPYTATAKPPPRKPGDRLPVTLLSGFLGAGKTTLLKRILTTFHGMKIAVVVNDMGALNIDSEEIAKHKLIQEEAQMIEFHNGCICCTLRGDLLKTVKEIAEEVDGEGVPRWEYLVIESTGISEPLPIAQTFVMDISSCGPPQTPASSDPKSEADGKTEVDSVSADSSKEHDHNHAVPHEPLSNYARLDTLVTVVDLYNILHVLSCDQNDEGERDRLLGDEAKKTKNGEPASLYQLLVDQLEFANVILLNKVDLVYPADPTARFQQVMKVGKLVRKFNPDAKILVPGYEFKFDDNRPAIDPPPAVDNDGAGQRVTTPSSRPPAGPPPRTPDEFSKFLTLMGKKLKEKEEKRKVAMPKPTSGQLTVSKFGDFDVGRVINTGLFNMQKAQMSAGWIRELQKDLAGIEHTPETEEYGIGSFVWRTDREDPRPFHPKRLSEILEGFGRIPNSRPRTADLSEESISDTSISSETRVEKILDHSEKPFLGVMRSKGTLWLAFAHGVEINFHSAGRQISLGSGNPFLAAVPKEYWNYEAQNQFQDAVVAGRWHFGKPGSDDISFGDRASVLVIIGMDMTPSRKKRITDALNSALLTDEEMADGIKAFKDQIQEHPWRSMEDPFFGGSGPSQMWALKFKTNSERKPEEGGEQTGATDHP